MISYLDTSFLVKLYVYESNSETAAEMVRRNRSVVILSSLNEVEMASAIHAKQSLPRDVIDAAYSRFRENLSAGSYERFAVGREVFQLARRLAEEHGASRRVQALDVLHVAAAMLGGAVAFGTFDERQGRLAEAVGLTLLR